MGGWTRVEEQEEQQDQEEQEALNLQQVVDRIGSIVMTSINSSMIAMVKSLMNFVEVSGYFAVHLL